MVSPGDPYTTADEAKEYTQIDHEDLGVSDSDDPEGTGETSWDLLLNALLNRASSRVETFTQRDFAHHTGETILLDGLGKRVLRLPHPVISVTTVKEDGDTQTEGRDEDFVWQRSGALIAQGFPTNEVVVTNDRMGSGTPPLGFGPDRKRSGQRKAYWQDDYQNIEVTLDYGYQDPPEDVVDATLHLVDHTLMGLSQKREAPIIRTDDFEVTANIPVAINEEIREMLRPYKVTQPTSAKVKSGGQIWGG